MVSIKIKFQVSGLLNPSFSLAGVGEAQWEGEHRSRSEERKDHGEEKIR